jgi:hypothetical protein
VAINSPRATRGSPGFDAGKKRPLLKKEVSRKVAKTQREAEHDGTLRRRFFSFFAPWRLGVKPARLRFESRQ